MDNGTPRCSLNPRMMVTHTWSVLIIPDPQTTSDQQPASVSLCTTLFPSLSTLRYAESRRSPSLMHVHAHHSAASTTTRSETTSAKCLARHRIPRIEWLLQNLTRSCAEVRLPGYVQTDKAINLASCHEGAAQSARYRLGHRCTETRYCQEWFR